MTIVIQPCVEVHEQSNGLLVATSPDFPMFVVAGSREQLRERVTITLRMVGQNFEGMTERQVLDSLKSRGISAEPVAETSCERPHAGEWLNVPVLLDV